ncbi:MAG: hypothetical protein Q8P38_10620 [Candidatus Nanopelagicales bacterium]|nr:hypothetical protein [Candidatus Nanopelagicales bacterium]MDZ7578477.1 hypothetical protein [Candidatus Nanopelagicales bacterium]
MRHKILARGALPAGVAAVLVLAGCASARPGAAAIVGDRVIEVATVADQMHQINGVLGLPPDAPSENGAIAVVSYDVGAALVEEAADILKAEVAAVEVEEAYGQQVLALGGEQQLFQVAAERGIAPSMIKTDLLTQLRVRAIAEALAPGAGQSEQEQKLLAAIMDIARRIGVEVSPRYGQWDQRTLQISDPANPVSAPESTPESVIPAR